MISELARTVPKTMIQRFLLLALLGLPTLACSGPSTPAASSTSTPSSVDETPPPSAPRAHDDPSTVFDGAGQSVAYFAGGCFWCMERPFENLDGVSEVVSGYIDGEVANPSYRQVSSGSTGHTEAIRVVYDPAQITYAALLEVFWHNIDPTDEGGQFCDRGSQYRTGVYVSSPEERAAAESSRDRAQAQLGESIVTEIDDASTFYDAEAYHQDFYRTHPERYTSYRTGCGRDRRLGQLWGDAAAH